MAKVKQIELKTSEWGRRVKDWSWSWNHGRQGVMGTKIAGARLLDEATGRRCCLGIVLRAYGVSDGAMCGRELPRDVAGPETALIPDWMISHWGIDLILKISDQAKRSTKWKFNRLKAEFAKHDIELVLVEDE